MGLDSVELVVDIEKYFNIRIADRDAENIRTVGDMTQLVARYLQISSTDMQLRNEVFGRIADSIRQQFPTAALVLTEPIAPYFPARSKQEWKAFEAVLGLQAPEPGIFLSNEQSWKNGISKLYHQTFPPPYQWEKITVAQFVDAVCARNCEALIDPAHVRSVYEVYIAVVYHTVQKVGVDYYEVAPEKAFADDLGVD